MQQWQSKQPRGHLDKLAWQILANIQLRLDARALQRIDAKATRVRRHLLQSIGKHGSTQAANVS